MSPPNPRQGTLHNTGQHQCSGSAGSRAARENEIITIIPWRVLPLQPRGTDEAETQPQKLSGGAQSHCGVLLASHCREVPASNGLM